MSNTLKVHSIDTFGTTDGPGIRLVIFTQGCNFRCLYCHNPDTQSIENNQAQQMDVEQILALLEKQKPYFKNGGGITFSGGEPTLHAQKLIPIFKKIKEQGFHIALDTNGGFYSPLINQLYDLTDLVILDVKHINDDLHQKLVGVSNQNTLLNAKYREETGKPLWLRYVLVPQYSDQEEYLEEWAKHFADYKTVERVEILPYHTLGVHKYEFLGKKNPLADISPPTKEIINKTEKIFRKYFNNKVIVH